MLYSELGLGRAWRLRVIDVDKEFEGFECFCSEDEED